MQEAGTGFASKPQTDDAEPGDIALDSWVRYEASFQIRSEQVRTSAFRKRTSENSLRLDDLR